MSGMFMLNRKYMVQILICCLSFNFLLCMVCLFLSQPARGCGGLVSDFSLRPLCLLHTPPHPCSCFQKAFHKTGPVHLQGPFAAVVWLLGRKREYFPCLRALWLLECFLLPQLLLSTWQGRELTNSCYPSLLICHRLLQSLAPL